MGASNAGAGSSDAPNTARSVVTKVKSQTPIRDFFKSGGVTGAIVRGVSGAIQKSKTDKMILSDANADYQGSKSKSNVGFTNNNGGGNDNNNQPVIIKKNIGETQFKLLHQQKQKYHNQKQPTQMRLL